MTTWGRGHLQASKRQFGTGHYSGGGLEKWPAHASMPDPGPGNVAVDKRKSLIMMRADVPCRVSKPKFLVQLETFLYRELIYLGVTDTRPSELRMQASRMDRRSGGIYETLSGWVSG